MGRENHVVLSDRWRYNRYADGELELYDHSIYPWEWENLAKRPEFKKVVINYEQ